MNQSVHRKPGFIGRDSFFFQICAGNFCGKVIRFALFYGLMSQYALAQVTLLVERGASTYQQAAHAFRDEIGPDASINEIQIDESGRLPQNILQEIKTRPPQLIVAIGTRAAGESLARFPNLPMLYCLALRPVQSDVQKLNVGGVFLDADILRQIESARKVLPNLRNVGIVYDPMTSGSIVRELQKHFIDRPHVFARMAQTPQAAAREIESLFNTVLGPGDAFVLLLDSVVANPANFKSLIELSLKNKVPLIAPARPFVEAGALMSTGADYEQAGRQIATMARQVLRGAANPRDLGFVSPTRFMVTINAVIAGQLGLTIPADLEADILGVPQVRAAP